MHKIQGFSHFEDEGVPNHLNLGSKFQNIFIPRVEEIRRPFEESGKEFHILNKGNLIWKADGRNRPKTRPDNSSSASKLRKNSLISNEYNGSSNIYASLLQNSSNERIYQSVTNERKPINRVEIKLDKKFATKQNTKNHEVLLRSRGPISSEQEKLKAQGKRESSTNVLGEMRDSQRSISIAPGMSEESMKGEPNYIKRIKLIKELRKRSAGKTRSSNTTLFQDSSQRHHSRGHSRGNSQSQSHRRQRRNAEEGQRSSNAEWKALGKGDSSYELLSQQRRTAKGGLPLTMEGTPIHSRAHLHSYINHPVNCLNIHDLAPSPLHNFIPKPCAPQIKNRKHLIKNVSNLLRKKEKRKFMANMICGRKLVGRNEKINCSEDLSRHEHNASCNIEICNEGSKDGVNLGDQAYFSSRMSLLGDECGSLEQVSFDQIIAPVHQKPRYAPTQDLHRDPAPLKKTQGPTSGGDKLWKCDLEKEVEKSATGNGMRYRKKHSQSMADHEELGEMKSSNQYWERLSNAVSYIQETKKRKAEELKEEAHKYSWCQLESGRIHSHQTPPLRKGNSPISHPIAISRMGGAINSQSIVGKSEPSKRTRTPQPYPKLPAQGVVGNSWLSVLGPNNPPRNSQDAKNKVTKSRTQSVTARPSREIVMPPKQIRNSFIRKAKSKTDIRADGGFHTRQPSMLSSDNPQTNNDSQIIPSSNLYIDPYKSFASAMRANLSKNLSRRSGKSGKNRWESQTGVHSMLTENGNTSFQEEEEKDKIIQVKYVFNYKLPSYTVEKLRMSTNNYM